MKRSIFLITFLFPTLLFAHAEEPSAERHFYSGDLAYTKANFGLVAEHFTGMVCEEAFVGGDGWKLGVLGENEWVVLGENNIQRTTDGCEFDVVKSTADLIIPDFAVAPNKESLAYIANAGDEEGVWLSKNRGVSFEKIDFDTTELQLTALKFIDDDTFVVSGYTPEMDGEGFLLEVTVSTGTSSNLTMPAVKFPYLLDANENGLVWLGRAETLTVYWGPTDQTDARSYIPRSWPTGAALSEDGMTVYIGGVENGQAIARGDINDTYEIIFAEQVVGCIDRRDSDLFICGLERRDGADVFKLLSDTELEIVEKFSDLRGPRTDCAAETDVGTVCPLVWKEIASYFGQEVPVEPTDDVGVADMGTDMNSVEDANGSEDAGKEAPASGGCCTTTGKTKTGWLFAFLILVAYRRRK